MDNWNVGIRPLCRGSSVLNGRSVREATGQNRKEKAKTGCFLFHTAGCRPWKQTDERLKTNNAEYGNVVLIESDRKNVGPIQGTKFNL